MKNEGRRDSTRADTAFTVSERVIGANGRSHTQTGFLMKSSTWMGRLKSGAVGPPGSRPIAFRSGGTKRVGQGGRPTPPEQAFPSRIERISVEARLQEAFPPTSLGPERSRGRDAASVPLNSSTQSGKRISAACLPFPA